MFNNSNKEEDINEKRRPSYMPTRGLAAVLNQGLATLGEKLGKYNLDYYLLYMAIAIGEIQSLFLTPHNKTLYMICCLNVTSSHPTKITK